MILNCHLWTPLSTTWAMRNFRFFFLLLFCGSHLDAQIVFDGEPIAYFGEQIEGFSTERDWSPEEVVLKDSLFHPVEAAVPNLGVTPLHHWFRFRVKNEVHKERVFLNFEYPSVDVVDAYLLDELGHIVRQSHAGESRPFHMRDNGFKNFAFDLELEYGESGMVLLHMQSGEQLIAPLKIQSYDSLVQSSLFQNTFFGLYAGIIVVMFFYNLFIFFSTRDRAYLLYVVYIFAIGLTQLVLQGYGFAWFWPNSPAVAILATYIVGAFSGIAVLLFAREFLKIREAKAWLDYLIIAFVVLDVVAIVLALLGLHNVSYNIINAVAAIGSVYLLVIAAWLAQRGARAARFFLVAWSIFLFSILFYVFKDYGLIAYNEFTSSSLMVGSAIEVVLLSFALADRINVFKQASEEAQKRELTVIREKEKLVSEQNILLEQKVSERTVALRSANEQLSKAMDELKQAQVQLVNAEKMASLGQLTAGIAHEINNPINFVAASVTPLKRDLDEVVALVQYYDKMLSEAELPEKLGEARKFRQEIDYDFTIQEIDELLKGVDEGAKRTAEIVQGLKHFSRLDESDSKFADIHECLESTLIVLRNMIKDRIEMVKDFDTSIPEIECFPGKLNQVFSNIISNAIQAMDDAPSARLTIATKDLGEEIRVSISDNGPGIPEEIRTKIFEPFFTTKDVGDGTGLGLSIVYSIIEQHHGRMELESEVGQGTSFIFFLPKAIH